MSQTEFIEKGNSLWQDAFYRLKKNKLAMFGFVFVSIVILLAIITPLIAPYSYQEQNLILGAVPPNGDHWFGTDTLGRDLLTRVLYGGRISLMVGFVATFVSLVIGVLWGTIAGFLGGKVDSVMMRIVDIMFSLPFILFVIMLMVVFGRNIFLIFIAIGAVEWLPMARIVRSQVVNLRKQEFVEACFSLGFSKRRIILKHLILNVLGQIIIYTSLTIPSVMLFESFLSYLGLGIQPPMSSWGSLISSGVETMEEFPWLFLFPGVVFTLTLFSLNFLGDGLRDALDPRASKD